MRLLILLLVVASAMCSTGTAQSPFAPSLTVGLTLSGGGIRIGQLCGSLECTPARVQLAAGNRYTLTTYARPGEPFVVVVGAVGSCRAVPRIAGSFILDRPIHTLAIGRIGPLDRSLGCLQGIGTTTLKLPPRLPPGFTFAVQSLSHSTDILSDNNPGQLALSQGIAVQVR